MLDSEDSEREPSEEEPPPCKGINLDVNKEYDPGIQADKYNPIVVMGIQDENTCGKLVKAWSTCPERINLGFYDHDKKEFVAFETWYDESMEKTASAMFVPLFGSAEYVEPIVNVLKQSKEQVMDRFNIDGCTTPENSPRFYHPNVTQRPLYIVTTNSGVECKCRSRIREFIF